MTPAEKCALLAERFPDLTRTTALLFVALSDGRLHSYQAIHNFLDDELDRPDTPAHLTSAAKRLRRAIEGEGFKIRSRLCIGYQLIAPKGWVAPWA